MRAYNAIIHHLFQKENAKQVDAVEMDKLLVKYPYMAHLHWVNAIKNEKDKAVLHKAGLYACYPGILHYYLNDSSKPEITKQSPPKPVIQPLFTADYFAYTRTRLPEKMENDKPPTMEQVKSFTGWLRMMKKPQPVEKLESELEEIDPAGEKSLKKEQVMTESMAEIWIQHGRPEEAVHIYNKLILLNPEKKGYFAAKISALKKQ